MLKQQINYLFNNVSVRRFTSTQILLLLFYILMSIHCNWYIDLLKENSIDDYLNYILLISGKYNVFFISLLQYVFLNCRSLQYLRPIWNKLKLYSLWFNMRNYREIVKYLKEEFVYLAFYIFLFLERFHRMFNTNAAVQFSVYTTRKDI